MPTKRWSCFLPSRSVPDNACTTSSTLILGGMSSVFRMRTVFLSSNAASCTGTSSSDKPVITHPLVRIVLHTLTCAKTIAVPDAYCVLVPHISQGSGRDLRKDLGRICGRIWEGFRRDLRRDLGSSCGRIWEGSWKDLRRDLGRIWEGSAAKSGWDLGTIWETSGTDFLRVWSWGEVATICNNLQVGEEARSARSLSGVWGVGGGCHNLWQPQEGGWGAGSARSHYLCNDPEKINHLKGPTYKSQDSKKWRTPMPIDYSKWDKLPAEVSSEENTSTRGSSPDGSKILSVSGHGTEALAHGE